MRTRLILRCSLWMVMRYRCCKSLLESFQWSFPLGLSEPPVCFRTTWVIIRWHVGSISHEEGKSGCLCKVYVSSSLSYLQEPAATHVICHFYIGNFIEKGLADAYYVTIPVLHKLNLCRDADLALFPGFASRQWLACHCGCHESSVWGDLW